MVEIFVLIESRHLFDIIDITMFVPDVFYQISVARLCSKYFHKTQKLQRPLGIRLLKDVNHNSDN